MSQPETTSSEVKIKLSQHDKAHKHGKKKRDGCICDCGNCPCKDPSEKNAPAKTLGLEGQHDAEG